jgi:hypothetical protein
MRKKLKKPKRRAYGFNPWLATCSVAEAIAPISIELGSDNLRVCSLSITEAEEFLESHGRHYKTPAEPICAIGVKDKALHGAAILGRRADGDGELAHIYVDGISQGYSLLYGACWRALKALGYEKAAL